MEGDPAGSAPRMRPCPICARPAAQEYKPFCSKRCADVDLARWLGGRYAIPAGEDDDDGDADFTPAPRPDGSNPGRR